MCEARIMHITIRTNWTVIVGYSRLILGGVTTFSGSTTDSGYVDGEAVSCKYSSPMGLATEPTGTFIVVDGDNRRLRRVRTDGERLVLVAVCMFACLHVGSLAVPLSAHFGRVTCL